MTSFVWIVLLASLVATKAQDGGFDLADAFGDDDLPTEKPKVPDAPKIPEPAAPAGGGGGLDLNDAFDIDNTPADPKKPAGGDTPTDPKKPASGGDLDLNDAFGGSDPEPDKPAVVPPKDGGTGGTGGGSFNDNDLFDVSGGSDYKPDKGKGGARPSDDSNNDPRNGPAADQPAEAGGGQMAGILSAVGVAIVGAASSYFAYQKKKLCFKIQGGQDPESGKHHQGTESEPQVLSNLLRTS